MFRTTRRISDQHIVPVTIIDGTGLGISGAASAQYVTRELCDEYVDGRIVNFHRVFGLGGTNPVVVGDYLFNADGTATAYTTQGTVTDCCNLVPIHGTVWNQLRVPALGFTTSGLTIVYLYVEVISVDDPVDPPTLGIAGESAVDLYEGQRMVFQPIVPSPYLEGPYVFTASADDIVIVRYAEAYEN